MLRLGLTLMDSSSPHDPAFWDQRYQAGRIPWDCGGVPGALKGFLERNPRGGQALVPGCGSGYEVRAFHAAGWEVLAIDFSSAAVDRARQLLGPLAGCVCAGDFFAPSPAAGSFDLVYERTFLCALPPERWPDYFRRMAELIRPGGALGGFFFFGPEDEPPPYPISRDELRRGLAGSFELEADETVTDSLPLYAGKERWQVWRRRGAAGHPGDATPSSRFR